MIASAPTEALVEQQAAEGFREQGFAVLSGRELDSGGERRDALGVILASRTAVALHRLNPSLPRAAIEDVTRTLAHPLHPTLIQNNRWFHGLLVDGVPVEYRDAKSGELRGGRARLVDFDNPGANDLLAVRQLTVAGASGKHIRPDMVLFLNGLPIAVIELKDPADEKADLGIAIGQLKRYMATAPDLFVPNVLCVVAM